MNKQRHPGRLGGWSFLLVVVLLHGTAWQLYPGLGKEALILTGELLYKMLPVLVLVFVLIFLSNLLVTPGWVRKNVGRKSGRRGWVTAIIGGILSVGPVYVWYALLKDLRSKGMRTALIAAFLYSRGIKLPLLPLLIHYFGFAFTLILAGYLTLFSIITGILLEWIVDDRQQDKECANSPE